jgi:hypothetical protein
MFFKRFLVAFSLATYVCAFPGVTLQRRADGYVDPRDNGGSMLDDGWSPTTPSKVEK